MGAGKDHHALVFGQHVVDIDLAAAGIKVFLVDGAVVLPDLPKVIAHAGIHARQGAQLMAAVIAHVDVRPGTQGLGDLLGQVARPLGQLAQLLARHVAPLEDELGLVQAGGPHVREELPGVHPLDRRSGLLGGLQGVNVILQWLPGLARPAHHDRPLEDAGAEQHAIADHIARHLRVVGLGELILDLPLHGLGVLLGLLEQLPGNGRLRHRLAVRAHQGLAVRRRGGCRRILRVQQFRYRGGQHAPVAVIGREQHVYKTRLGRVGLWPGDVDEGPAALGLLDGLQVAGRVLAMVLAHVIQPAVLDLAAQADLIVGHLAQPAAQDLQPLGTLGLLAGKDVLLGLVFAVHRGFDQFHVHPFNCGGGNRRRRPSCLHKCRQGRTSLRRAHRFRLGTG